MAPSDISAKPGTNTEWDHQYNTLRRENLFRHPPTDHSAYPLLQQAVNPHIEAFDAIFRSSTGRSLVDHAIADIGHKVFADNAEGSRNQLTVRIKSVDMQKCFLPPSNTFAKNREIYPSECRERHATYRGRLTAVFEYQINNGEPREFQRDLGLVPIMVKSRKCHLRGMSPAELVKHKEESEEMGGYFIINGNEKLIRLLQVNRRNFPLAVVRPSFTNRGVGYTQYGIIFRSLRPDETSQTNVLHYLNDGNVTFRFSWRKAEYLLPVVMLLKALVDTSDREIFEGLIGPAGSKAVENTFLTDRVEILLRTFKTYNLHTKDSVRAYIGEKFRPVLDVPETMSDYDVGTEFLRKVVLVHLGNTNVTQEQDYDKFKLLLLMIRKLYAMAAGECAADNVDAVQNHEILLGGFLYAQIIKERLDEIIGHSLRLALNEYLRSNPANHFTSTGFQADFPSKIFRKVNDNIGRAMEYFMSTGNLSSPTGLDLQQANGFTVVAEKLNFMRFISHFRMVHRGSFFAQLKTTAVRKLLPESWGFLCPVHTPDGSPCGLLSHMAHKCKIITEAVDASAVPALAYQLGAVESSAAAGDENVPIMLDGKMIGWASLPVAKRIADSIRHWKVEGSHNVPLYLEVGYVPKSNGGSFPGVYMSSTASRMVRPVRYLPLDKEDWVGPQEQPYMSIACVDQEIKSGQTHVEFLPTNMLSILANMTPFSDHNQSPRNMYQCQMAKQTMGTPATAIAHRTDHKMYRIQTGQTPVVRSPLHNAYGLDNFPNGMNSVVAVISYTGYDMDDAMILNKSSHERGFGHGTIYKTHVCSLKSDSRSRTARSITKMFGFPKGAFVKDKHLEALDEDGLPHVGRMVREGDVLCAWHTIEVDYNGNYVNHDGQVHFELYKDSETGFIDQVRLIGAESGTEPLQQVSIKIRIPRAPVIGDKFSSRHGQKGVASQRWPSVDMPFTESGMQPDTIINPHAFPSRMTIGMFVESLAGKAGALHGLAQDSTPFQFDEMHTAGDYFGEQLIKAGYNYHGNEPMYSGITGEELHVDIYIGVVYYQRLRHMVNDKYQVRSTGPIVQTTGQPVQGRKRAGGIRVGEMERDSLLAHGTAFLLKDRLLNCSDYAEAWMCRRCGSFLSVQPVVPRFLSKQRKVASVRCRKCAIRADEAKADKWQGETWEDGQGVQYIGGDDTSMVAIPGVLRYLDVELAAMGVKLKYHASTDDVVRKGMRKPLKWDGQNLGSA
ncbi:DNA-directed RNA polymerase I subunit RPA2 [Ceratocystis lukuohia]|uniref:DNA-directed RNA polymerase subunit beta n=1 Tax=Ceratocystis lukuohia TaxID=2019550 RepID=A0ABR4MAT4_9PEZI